MRTLLLAALFSGVGLAGASAAAPTTPTRAEAPMACGVPTLLSATNITNNSADLNWTGDMADNYSLQYREFIVGTTTTWNTIPGIPNSPYPLNGLTPNKTYRFRVAATCAGVLTAYSAYVQFNTLAAGCIADSYEGNDSMPVAKTVAKNVNLSATLCPGDVDWYKVNVQSSAKNLRVQLLTVPANYDLYVYSSLGALVGSSENTGTTAEIVVANNLTIGTYFIKVVGVAGASSATAYTFNASTAATAYPVPCTDDAYEPNETQAAAKSIAKFTAINATLCTGDLDWFNFIVNTAQKNVKVQLPFVPANYSLALYNATGVLVGSSNNAGTAAEEVIANNLVPGTYSILVSGVSGVASGTAYSLIINTSATAYCGTDAYEPNESLPAAAVVVAGATGTAVLCPADIDFFRVTTGATTTNLKVELTNLPVNFDLNVYDGLGNQIAFSNNAGTNAEAAIANNLMPSTAYYFQVVAGVGASSTLPYTFKTTLSSTPFSTCPADTYEPNETLVGAKIAAKNVVLTARICDSTDEDWYKVNVFSSAPNLSVNIFSTPADYNLTLYTSAGAVIGVSNNAGATPEQINANNITAGTYYFKVYSFKGAASPNSYNFGANTSAAPFRIGAPTSVAAELPAMLTLYPNPAHDGDVTLRWANFDQTGNAQITLLSVDGKVLQSTQAPQTEGTSQAKLATANLAAGVYVVRVATGTLVHTQRLVITK